MSFFGNVHHDWEYLKKLAKQCGDWELYEFACRMQAAEKKYTPKAPWEE